MENKEYASKEFVDELYLRKEHINITIHNCITFKDKSTGWIYNAYIEDGVWTTSCAIKEIKVATMPNKINYMTGDFFDPSGMVLTAISYNGIEQKITVDDNKIDDIVVLGSTVLFPYIDPISGLQYEVIVDNLEVEEFNPDVMLIDFNYIANNDGTYKLTGWKETLNGEPSTELIIPNNNLIIV